MSYPTSFDPERAASEIWQAFIDAECIREGVFNFASGQEATLKIDASELYKHPKQLQIVLGHTAVHPFVQETDVLIYVPDGMRTFATILGEDLGLPVAHMRRKPNATSRYDFEFRDWKDQKIAFDAKNPVILEDVVSTLGSVAGVRKVLRPGPTINSLALLLRGEVNPAYQTGVNDQYLVKKYIPIDKDEFTELYGPIAVSDAQSP